MDFIHKNRVLVIILKLALWSFFITFPVSSLAQGNAAAGALDGSFEGVKKIQQDSGVKSSDFTQFIEEVLKVATGLVGIIALAVLIFGGFMYITSAGDSGKAEKAKTLILYAIIGLIIIGAAAIIVNTVIGFYNE